MPDQHTQHTTSVHLWHPHHCLCHNMPIIGLYHIGNNIVQTTHWRWVVCVVRNGEKEMSIRGSGYRHRREGGQGQRQQRSSTSSRPPAIPKLPKCRSLDNKREPYGHGCGYHPLGRNGFLSKYATALPPVIALNRSSFSTTSDSSTSSSFVAVFEEDVKSFFGGYLCNSSTL